MEQITEDVITMIKMLRNIAKESYHRGFKDGMETDYEHDLWEKSQEAFEEEKGQKAQKAIDGIISK